jgi:hypothetical protein
MNHKSRIILPRKTQKCPNYEGTVPYYEPFGVSLLLKSLLGRLGSVAASYLV